MDFDLRRTAQITGLLLLIAAVTQAIYTALYVSDADVPRRLLWGTEAFLFVMMAAFAGSAMAQDNRHHLAWSAIAAASVLNVVQVGIGLTQFGPFYEAVGKVEGMAPAAHSVVALSFMIYNAAKILLALALLVFAVEKRSSGSQILGNVSLLIAFVALVTNTASMAVGRDVFGELPLAGGSGVLATILLGVCILMLPSSASD